MFVAVDLKEKRITVIGEANLVFLIGKLRKFGLIDLLSVGPTKEDKKEEGEKKEDAKNEEKKMEPPIVVLKYRQTQNKMNFQPHEAQIIDLLLYHSVYRLHALTSSSQY